MDKNRSANMKKIIGCGTALVTPFTKNGEVDYKTFSKLIKRQINNGIDFLVPLGSTGETGCLSNQEKAKILEITVEKANGKLPVIVGAGSTSTQNALDNIKLLQKSEPDGFLIVTPCFNKPTQTGLYNYFKTIADATDKAIILYNIPDRTGVNLSAETCLRLAEIKNIIAVKESSSNYKQINEIICHAPSCFTVFSGNDIETLPLMAIGAKGVISVASNIAPKEVSNLVTLLLKNNFIAGRKLHCKLANLFNDCFIETNPIPVKAGLHKMNLIENVLRCPLYPATEKTKTTLISTIKKLRLL